MKAFWAWIVKAFNDLLGFLKDSSGKFSHKRLIALAFAVVGIFLLFHGEWWGAGISGSVVAVLAAISAITKT
jgi:hypothetical protein